MAAVTTDHHAPAAAAQHGDLPRPDEGTAAPGAAAIAAAIARPSGLTVSGIGQVRMLRTGSVLFCAPAGDATASSAAARRWRLGSALPRRLIIVASPGAVPRRAPPNRDAISRATSSAQPCTSSIVMAPPVCQPP